MLSLGLVLRDKNVSKNVPFKDIRLIKFNLPVVKMLLM